MSDDVIKSAHQVDVGLASPISTNTASERLSIAGRPVKVDHHGDVAIGGKQIGIPTVGPGIIPGPFRAAVDEEFHRIFLTRIEVWRLEDEAFHALAIGAAEPERLQWGH